MDTKTIIIIPNELEVNIKPFFYKCDNYHIEGFNKFIYQNDISISSPLRINSDDISKELTDQGYIVILIDNFYNKEENIKNFVIFLPEKISPAQFEYFTERKEYIKDYNMMILKKEENEKFKYVDQTTTDNPIIDELFELLNNRMININKKKKLITKSKKTNDDIL